MSRIIDPIEVNPPREKVVPEFNEDNVIQIVNAGFESGKIIGDGSGISAQQAELIAKGAIAADKDILSKITYEYDEDENMTYIKFPKNIMPIRVYLSTHEYEEYTWFDYCNMETKSAISNVYNVFYNEDDKFFTLGISGNYVAETDIYELLYIPFSDIDVNAGLSNPNWYTILNPQPAGTKLFKHTLEGTENNAFYRFIFISDKGTKLTYSQFREHTLSKVRMVTGASSFAVSEKLWAFSGDNGVAPSMTIIDTSTMTATTVNLTDYANFTDTITEL